MAIYVVKEGDYVNLIADYYGVEAEKIIYDNQLVPPYTLAVGQSLFIDVGERSEDTQMRINGYAYPFISNYVLTQTLPYLSCMSVFSYGFTMQGELVPPVLDDKWMIDLSREYSVVPILTLTPLGPDGNFNNGLISSVVNNVQYSYRLIYQVLATVEAKNFGAVDIDFEYILKDDRYAFTEFVGNMREVMNESGYEVSVAVAPKTSDEQAGLLFEGKDYAGLGEAANHVLLMTYEYGYKYGPNMAVAPINQVERVVQYAVTKIPTWKLNLGIPNYGYDWILPFVRNQTVAVTIGNVEAVRIAVSNGAVIKFDEDSKSPYFNYMSGNDLHEVWFEDVRSILAKINLIKEYGLEGAGYWQINQLFRANWLLLNQQTIIEKTI